MSPFFMMKTIYSNYRFFLSATVALTLLLTTPCTYADKHLFDSEPSSTQAAPAQQMIAQPADDTEIAEPAISATDAALRAQQQVDGKVMNVRQFQDDNKIFYGVKVLQKNGRIKTINVDANNGNIVE